MAAVARAAKTGLTQPGVDHVGVARIDRKALRPAAVERKRHLPRAVTLLEARDPVPGGGVQASHATTLGTAPVHDADELTAVHGHVGHTWLRFWPRQPGANQASERRHNGVWTRTASIKSCRSRNRASNRTRSRSRKTSRRRSKMGKMDLLEAIRKSR